MLERKNQKIAIYVPSTDYETAVPDYVYANRILKTQLFLVSLFGGSTTLDHAHGHWLTDDKKLIGEHVTIVNSWGTTEQLFDNTYLLLSYVSKALKTWEQHCVSLEVLRELILIDSSTDLTELEASIVLSIADYIEA